MVEAGEDRGGHDLGAGGQVVAVGQRWRREALGGLWEAGAEAGVGAPAVVVGCPFSEEAAEVVFAEGDEPVEALPPEGADEALAEGVGSGRTDGGADDAQAHGRRSACTAHEAGHRDRDKF